ncbi:alanine/glycine:cation symporter family protein [Georgenia ruanii]|uniref:Amino acid carrier protein n=1 Tax=Georgenia ruanii TaxID=348442 RepID=A0A7J9V0P7_9MICO|nr:alanine/glycine:cation symporter family protein [Georgenia ruanii]MPV90183.1 amino acid carrier protein [Georgenia ruanii]
MTDLLTAVNDAVYTYVLIGLLVLVGIVMTWRTRAVQVRLFPQMLAYVTRSRRGADGGISSFQAFAIGMATRIGIGNITGVALALILGGPGAIFWMWLVSLVGMATSFAEATLAQVFKVRATDGTFRGGPAYYIARGLGSRRWGTVFAVLLVLSMAVAMPMVQANTISMTVQHSHGVPTWVSGLVLVVLTALVVFGGVKLVARVAEVMTPAMALAYVATAAAVIVLNLDAVPQFFADIFAGAFGLRAGLAGVGGGVVAAVLNGVRRGLFSNEAGMGTNPNAAATATVAHPVQQGLIQSLGVFVDTMFVCTSTAFIILATGASVFVPGATPVEAGAELTTTAVTSQLGAWTAWPMTVMIFFFGFSSILGAFAYAEVNMDFLRAGAPARRVLRGVVVLTTGVGALLALQTVWTLMDTAMAVITVVNLVALVRLAPWVAAVLRDYERQRAAVAPERRRAAEPRFVAAPADLPAPLPGDVWSGEPVPAAR